MYFANYKSFAQSCGDVNGLYLKYAKLNFIVKGTYHLSSYQMTFLKSSNRVAVILLLLCYLIPSRSYAESEFSTLFNEEHKFIIEDLDTAAKTLAASNMNKFAYEKLRRLDFVFDSLYKLEKKDTIAKIEGVFTSYASNKKPITDSMNKRIGEITVQKNSLEKTKSNLIRRALFSFALWLPIVFIILQFRNKSLRKSKVILEKTQEQLKKMEEQSSKAKVFLTILPEKKDKLEKLMTEVQNVEAALQSEVKDGDAKNNFIELVNNLSQNINREERIADALLMQQVGTDGQFINADINEICGIYTDLVTRGMSQDITIPLSKDFEKNLPNIKINSTAVGTLIINVLINAYQSVNDKIENGTKNFQPKISVSTRILPSFLQIRIRDNGTGMNDEILKRASEEFYTTRASGKGAGLGLYFANQITKEIHRGEVKIESEEGNNTDVYIKFFR